jgi:hypothetical protein
LKDKQAKQHEIPNSEEFIVLRSSSGVVKIVKPQRLSQAGHVAREYKETIQKSSGEISW